MFNYGYGYGIYGHMNGHLPNSAPCRMCAQAAMTRDFLDFYLGQCVQKDPCIERFRIICNILRVFKMRMDNGTPQMIANEERKIVIDMVAENLNERNDNRFVKTQNAMAACLCKMMLDGCGIAAPYQMRY